MSLPVVCQKNGGFFVDTIPRGQVFQMQGITTRLLLEPVNQQLCVFKRVHYCFKVYAHKKDFPLFGWVHFQRVFAVGRTQVGVGRVLET